VSKGERADRFWSYGACPLGTIDLLVLAGRINLPVIRIGPGDWEKKTKESMQT
jgi:hypothetical protein